MAVYATAMFHDWTLREIATRVRTGEVSARAVQEATWARIERFDPDLKSFATPTPELAMRQAEAVDAAIAAGRTNLPLAGVPVGVKDLCATRDAPTHAGTIACMDWNPGVDATVVERLRDAGAVLVGKLVTTEAASGVHHPEIKPPKNPWHEGYWTGASSSGSGAATAAGLCSVSLGSDTGGSIRYPSACCGLVGLKPTWGRVSRFGVFPLAGSLDHVGPMARSVDDAAVVLDVLSGRDERDPTTLTAVPPVAVAETRDWPSLRVGYDERYCSEGVAPEVAAAIERAVSVLRDVGASIRPVRVPERDETIPAWLVLCAVEAVAAHEGSYPERAEQYGPGLTALLEYGRKQTHAEVARASEDRVAARRDWEALFRDVDLIITPSMFYTTPTLEQGRQQMRGEGMRRLVRFTAPANLTGLPTLSLPAGLDGEGVPYGYQLVGRPLGESELCRVGTALEAVIEFPKLWDRRPSFS